MIEIWEKHGISKPRKAVEDKLRLRFIPKFKQVFVKSPPKSEKIIEQKLEFFSEIFMLSESPAKRMREGTPNELVEDEGKKLCKNDFFPC